MDDQFLRDLKKQPDPLFAARLRATLRALPPNAVARVAPAAGLRDGSPPRRRSPSSASRSRCRPCRPQPKRFSISSASRNSRVCSSTRNDSAAWRRAASSPEAIFGAVEPLTPPPEPVSYATAADAGAAAGIRVRTPAWVPNGFSSTGFMASSEHGGANHDQHRRSAGGARYPRARRRRVAAGSRRSDGDRACAAGRHPDVRES